MAHKWAKWLRHPCRLGYPTTSQRGAKLEVAHLWAKWLRHFVPFSGTSTAAKLRAKSGVAHLWAKWLRHHWRVGDPQRFRAGGKIISGPFVGKMATSPVPSREWPPLQSGGQNHKWPTCGQSGYVTPVVSGISTA